MKQKRSRNKLADVESLWYRDGVHNNRLTCMTFNLKIRLAENEKWKEIRGTNLRKVTILDRPQPTSVQNTFFSEKK